MRWCGRFRIRAPRRKALLLVVALGDPDLPTCAAQEGQEATLTMDVGASYSLPPAGGIGEPSEYLNGGLRLAGSFADRAYWHVGGHGGLGLRSLASNWASILAGGGILSELGPAVAAGVAVTGEAFTVGSPFPYRAATLRIEPELSLGRGGTSVRIRLNGGIGTSEVRVQETFFRDTRSGRMRFQVGTNVTTALWSWGAGLGVSQRMGAITPHIGVEAYKAPQGRYIAARLGIEVGLAGGPLSIEGALWDTPYGGEPSIVAALQLFTGPTTGVVFAGGHYGPDPLLDVPAAGSAGAALRWDVARFADTPELRTEVSGSGEPVVRLRLRAPAARQVDVVGDFTAWDRIPLLREGDDWIIELPVELGVQHFGFVVDDEWYVPSDAPGRASDEWGGEHATLIVPGEQEPPM